jgi:hypothetical protein
LDDLRALLDYVAIHANQVVMGRQSGGEPRSASGKPQASEQKASIAELTDPGLWEQTHLNALGSAINKNSSAIEALHHIGKLLLGHPILTSQKNLSISHNTRKGQAEEMEEEAEHLKTINVLDSFNEKLNATLSDEAISDEDWARLAVIEGAVNLDMHLRRLGDVSAAWRYAESWTRKVAHRPLNPEARKLIDEQFFGLAAALATHTRNIPPNRDQVFGVSLTPQLVHEWFEAFNHGASDADQAIKLSRSWLSHEIAALLLGEEHTEASDGLTLALDSPTTKAVIGKALGSSRYQPPPGILNADEIALIKAIHTGHLIHKVVSNKNITACPKCYRVLIDDTRIRLRNRRIAECIHCHTVLLWLGD